MQPRALVTGGTGFIGSNLAFELESQGYSVIVVDRTKRLENLEGFRGQILERDISKPFEIDGAVDFVFHQAAITDPRYVNGDALYRQNIDGFKHIIDLCLAKNARLIYASTAGLYGNGPCPMAEDQPKHVLTVYGQSKLDMDLLAETLFDKMPVIGLRYFNVFGPREAHKERPASMIYHLYHQMKEGKRPRLFKFGEHERDFIYVKDAVYANLCAMTAPSGVYNVGTGIGTTFNQLVEVLNSVLGTNLDPEYFDMPYDPFTYQHHTIASTKLAEEKLKFKARRSFADAVKDYVNWLSKS